MADHTTGEEPVRKGKSNAILTYETVEEIKLGIQEVGIKLDYLSNTVSAQDRRHDDHEVRIRALELSSAGNAASRGLGSWLVQLAWPAAGVLIALLSYLQNSTP